MQQSTVLITHARTQTLRAYEAFKRFLSATERYKPIEYFNEALCNTDFRELKGFLTSFFESNGILVSVIPYNISRVSPSASPPAESRGEGQPIAKWKYYIYIEGTDIIETDFAKREHAEFVAYQKCFQFLDNKILVEQNKDRFVDQSADSCNFRVNWEAYDKIITAKRKMAT